ncbi:MAG: hypothetical protein IJ240_10695 [Clostridia bacterium]|nr:hypothetical protein [Clostridia bacterium]
MKVFKRPIKVIILTLLSYLLDVCVMPHFQLNGVVGSASFAGLAIITVCYGKKAAFCAGMIIGILMETMLASVPVLYLLAYPIITMLCAQWFADLSERQREKRKMDLLAREDSATPRRFQTLYLDKMRDSIRRVGGLFRREDNLSPYIRIPLCAAVSMIIFNAVYMIYGYISGFGLTFSHFQRALLSVVYTVLIAAILTFPYRKFLGLLGRRDTRLMKSGEFQ